MIRRIIPILVIALTMGCQSTPNGENSQQIASAVKTAAYVGTFYALKEHPDWRLEFERAASELAVIEKAEVIDFATILAIINRLPVKELKSDEAALIITGATILLSDYAGALRLDQIEQLRPIVGALRQGIELGLGEPPSTIKPAAL